MVVMTDGVGTGGGYKVTLMTTFTVYDDDILILGRDKGIVRD